MCLRYSSRGSVRTGHQNIKITISKNVTYKRSSQPILFRLQLIIKVPFSVYNIFSIKTYVYNYINQCLTIVHHAQK